MSKFWKNCKYMNMMYAQCQHTNVSSPLFHTSRNSVLPYFARGENYTERDYLECLRPAAMRVSDAPTLAGDPRAPGPAQYEKGIKPEVYDKWNQVPNLDTNNDWTNTNAWWGRR